MAEEGFSLAAEIFKIYLWLVKDFSVAQVRFLCVCNKILFWQQKISLCLQKDFSVAAERFLDGCQTKFLWPKIDF